MKEVYYQIIKGPTRPNSETIQRWTRLNSNPAYREKINDILNKIEEDYLPWQEFKNKDWADNQKKEEIWFFAKRSRRIDGRIKTNIRDQEGNYFTFQPNKYLELLHYIDLELGGNFVGVENFSENDKSIFIRQNLIEESISSSLLEGANSSRKAAKKMLEEGKKPKSKGEQMIVNNHEVMKLIESELKHEEMSLGLLKELHRKITQDTIDPKYYGVFRETLDEKGNRLVIKPWDDFTITYTAPDKEFVEKEIVKFIEFANDKQKDKTFIHPLIKAILLHFWIGLLHPFEDGNGRLARVIFYWYMLKRGYWAFAYLSISDKILKSQKQYSMAFIYSEQDDSDLNYFIHYNVNKIKLARKHFHEYIKDQVKENSHHAKLVSSGHDLNNRQTKLLLSLFRKEKEVATLREYCIANQIGRVTATSDFNKLVANQFLTKKQNGRNVFFYPTDKIKILFK